MALTMNLESSRNAWLWLPSTLMPRSTITAITSVVPLSGRQNGTASIAQALLARLVNVNGIVYGKVYFPTRSNRLKDLGAAVGASWPTPNPSGIESIAWRFRWEDSGQGEFKVKLLAYNQADCNALRLLTAELQSLSQAADSRADVDFTGKPKQMATATGEQIHRLFDGILASAHEEYKRNKLELSGLFVPSEIASQATHSKKTSRQCRTLGKPSRTIVVPRKRKCIDHPEINLRLSSKISEHTLIDLAFTKTGCQKKIVKYVGKVAYCPQCNHPYSPPTIKRLWHKLYGHSFEAWAVHQRVAMRLPYEAITDLYELVFHEHVNQSSICGFMRQFAEKYAATEEYLARAILAGQLIHADETKIKVGGIAKYVWGLTDGKRAIFKLTDTRETDFLKELLDGYGGVLVSDFYGGYDSMRCRQQKCLVHLIRDLNNDLWKNPFLAEYELFVARIRDLLLPIFKDVERYGLKRRHLQKHMKSVDRFYRESIEVTWESDIIQTYQKRFVRYRESLFLFLNEDGIPWNNNMGERVLRHLAVQRKISKYLFRAGSNRLSDAAGNRPIVPLPRQVLPPIPAVRGERC